MINAIKRFLDLVVPRFVSEDYIMVENAKGVCVPFIPVQYYLDNIDHPDYVNFRPKYVSGINCFNLFGIGLLPKITETVEWEKYKELSGI